MVIAARNWFVMKKLSRPSFRFLRHHKKAVIITLCGLILIAVATYGFWSRQQWTQYQPVYTSQYETVKTSLNKLTTVAIATDKDKELALRQLRTTSQSIDKTHATLCDISPFVVWQESVIISLKKQREQCYEQQSKLADLSQQVKRTVRFIEDDNVTAKLLQGLPQVDEVADTAWQGQVATWQAKSQEIAKQTVGQDFKPAQQLAVQKTAAVAAAWQAVVAAHDAKDKQKYVASQADLAVAYDGLDEIAVKTAQVIELLAKAVDKEYQTAF
jgi:hypothetical protein